MENRNPLELIKAFVRKQPKVVYAVVAVGLLFVGSIILFYSAPRDNAFVNKMVRSFPYPIVWVNAHALTEHELSQNMDSVRRFYENQDFSSLGLRVDFTTEDGQKRLQVREREVLNKMVEDASFQAIAKKKGITITDDEVKQDIKNRIDAYGTGNEVEKNLDRLYGWNLKDFAQKVVMPALYQARLEEVYKKEVDQKGAKDKIESAEKELKEKSFGEVAQKYSEGSTKENGGSLGWFQLTDLAPELQTPVQNAGVGQSTPIIESSLGYHIILLDEKKTDNDIILYRISQIFAPKISFSTWLTAEMQELSIRVWSPMYVWNQERAQVDFQDEVWQQYEQSVYENTSQDALFVN